VAGRHLYPAAGDPVLLAEIHRQGDQALYAERSAVLRSQGWMNQGARLVWEGPIRRTTQGLRQRAIWILTTTTTGLSRAYVADRSVDASGFVLDRRVRYLGQTCGRPLPPRPSPSWPQWVRAAFAAVWPEQEQVTDTQTSVCRACGASVSSSRLYCDPCRDRVRTAAETTVCLACGASTADADYCEACRTAAEPCLQCQATGGCPTSYQLCEEHAPRVVCGAEATWVRRRRHNRRARAAGLTSERYWYPILWVEADASNADRIQAGDWVRNLLAACECDETARLYAEIQERLARRGLALEAADLLSSRVVAQHEPPEGHEAACERLRGETVEPTAQDRTGGSEADLLCPALLAVDHPGGGRLVDGACPDCGWVAAPVGTLPGDATPSPARTLPSYALSVEGCGGPWGRIELRLLGDPATPHGRMVAHEDLCAKLGDLLREAQEGLRAARLAWSEEVGGE